VTTVVMTLVAGLCAWVGVQVITPFVLMTIPAGGLTNPYPVMTEWMFASPAVFVTVNKFSSLTFVCPVTGIPGSTGATFTSFTTTLKLFVADNCGFAKS
jgi:hypothetical protein